MSKDEITLADELGEFKPCFVYNRELDLLEWINENCGHYSETVSKLHAANVLRAMDDRRIVGVQIWGAKAAIEREERALTPLPASPVSELVGRLTKCAYQIDRHTDHENLDWSPAARESAAALTALQEELNVSRTQQEQPQRSSEDPAQAREEGMGEDARRPEGAAEGAKEALRIEARCDECKRANPAPWFAENKLWNRVVGGPDAKGDPGGFLCPNCFIRRARTIPETDGAFKLTIAGEADWSEAERMHCLLADLQEALEALGPFAEVDGEHLSLLPNDEVLIIHRRDPRVERFAVRVCAITVGDLRRANTIITKHKKET